MVMGTAGRPVGWVANSKCLTYYYQVGCMVMPPRTAETAGSNGRKVVNRHGLINSCWSFSNCAPPSRNSAPLTRPAEQLEAYHRDPDRQIETCGPVFGTVQAAGPVRAEQWNPFHRYNPISIDCPASISYNLYSTYRLPRKGYLGRPQRPVTRENPLHRIGAHNLYGRKAQDMGRGSGLLCCVDASRGKVSLDGPLLL